MNKPNVAAGAVRLSSTRRRFSSRVGSPRSGLTLVEIMIALTMTLIVLGAMMTAFQYASEQMQSGRALMELANRARSAEALLRSDLDNLTLDPRPYSQTAAPKGYFEYVEGIVADDSGRAANLSAGRNWIDSYLGDVDDVLGMTVRSTGRPFRGRRTMVTAGSPPVVGPPMINESSLAEVVWFTTWNDLDGDPTTINFDESVRIHRRVLLIRPDFGVLATNVNLNTVNVFLANNDISCRVIATNAAATQFNIVANNLADLAVRKNRFCRIIDPFDPTVANNFPNEIDRNWLFLRRNPSNDDVLLTDVAAFDLKIYSPDANVSTVSNIVVEPGDPGYNPATSTTLGSFVDLGHSSISGGTGWFSGLCYGNNYSFTGNVYDTWTPFYESDGIDQDGDGLTDEGTDGIDNDGVNGVDDTGERETLPPYPYPVRGLEASIRLVEKGTKQVHQTTVVHSFVPE